MRRVAAFFVAIQLLFAGTTAAAQDTGGPYGSVRTVVIESWVEEWDPAAQRWVRISERASESREVAQSLPVVSMSYNRSERVSPVIAVSVSPTGFAGSSLSAPRAQYGPFLVTSATTASMIGPTDAATPAQFDAMLRDFPSISVLEMIEAPGTSHDIANLAVGRRIRAAGIATHVPNGGSVRSGAVELFLAGSSSTMEDGAQFAVHSWLDTYGREADDFVLDHPAHRIYLDYYVEMGMSEGQAQQFYSMTNSVPHHSALWLDAVDMRRWLGRERLPDTRLAQEPAKRESFDVPLPVIALTPPEQLHIPIDLQVRRFDLPPLQIEYGDISAITLAAVGTPSLDSRAAFP